jgi:hypothetical protein
MTAQTYAQPSAHLHRLRPSAGDLLQRAAVQHLSPLLEAGDDLAAVPADLPLTRTGLTPFTSAASWCPWLAGFQGWAMFLDIDYLCRADVAELFALTDDRYAVMVSKNVKRSNGPA